MINLLPPQQKEELKIEEKRKIILILGIIFLITLFYISLIFFSIEIYLSSELNSQKVLFETEEKKFKTSEIQDFQKKITILNENLLKLNSFYQEKIDLTEILEKISKTLPAGIYLTNLSWQKETSQIGLSGFALLREDLFILKENLEKEKGFEDIDFPPSNWVKPKEIDFNVTFKINPKK